MFVCVVVNAVNRSSEYEHQATTQDWTSAAGQERDSPPMGENIQPPRRTPDYNWKLAGATECSASCGQGQSGGFEEVVKGSTALVTMRMRGYIQVYPFFFRIQILDF